MHVKCELHDLDLSTYAILKLVDVHRLSYVSYCQTAIP